MFCRVPVGLCRGNARREEFEIGRILHLKSEIRNLKLNWESNLRFEMQDSSDFTISPLLVRSGLARSAEHGRVNRDVRLHLGDIEAIPAVEPGEDEFEWELDSV